MLMTFSILGIIGGLLCAVADILWDFKRTVGPVVFYESKVQERAI